MTMRKRCWTFALGVTLLMAGCASMNEGNKLTQRASIVDYLYPGKEPTDPAAGPLTAQLRLPFQLGVAVVPIFATTKAGTSEAERMELLDKLRATLMTFPAIGRVEAIPSTYLSQGGGFPELERIRQLLGVDQVLMLSYDQVQFAEAGSLSMLYWTGVGAYVVDGDKFDIHTVIDATLFDIPSHRLLLRATGQSKVKGAASMVNFEERARGARWEGQQAAIQDLLPRLEASLQSFGQSLPGRQDVRVTPPAGYDAQRIPELFQPGTKRP